MADVSKITGSNGTPYDIKDAKARGVVCTQAQYDAWEQAGTLDPDVNYFISDANGSTPTYASGVHYDNTDSGLVADDVQEAIDEINRVDSNTLIKNVYYEKTGNIVQVNFVGANIPANTGSYANRYVVGTLPVGYRPSYTIHIPWVSDNIGMLRISPEGEVSIRNSDASNAHDAFCNAVFIASN